LVPQPSVGRFGGFVLTQGFEQEPIATTQAAQEAADRRKDECQLRDAKRERVRSAHARALESAPLTMLRWVVLGIAVTALVAALWLLLLRAAALD
jgi:hypothetical protein